MKRRALTFVFAVLALAAAQDASAQIGQPWTDRAYFNLNVGFETATGTLSDAVTIRQYDEDGILETTMGTDSGTLVDLSLGARVWRNFSVGIGFHRGASTAEVAITGSVPHPLFFNRPRAIATNATDLDRTEQAVHLQFGYMMVVNDRLNVHLLLGPSFFRVKQEVVSGVSTSESGFPFNSVSAEVRTAERSDSPTGFNVGADISYKIYETGRIKLGGGMFIRYTSASADIALLDPVAGGAVHTVDSDLGGLQVGFGARVRF